MLGFPGHGHQYRYNLKRSAIKCYLDKVLTKKRADAKSLSSYFLGPTFIGNCQTYDVNIGPN